MVPSSLALFWSALIAFAILLYALLDGFDLGVGILFGTTRDQRLRVQMMNTVAPFWDGNETWLVVAAAGLFGAFPTAYGVFLSAFYFPVLLLLIGLIFRGVAFEFCLRSVRMRRVWDRGFAVGSTMAAFVQGATIGAMLRGIPVVNGHFAGGAFSWLHPFAILTGIGVVLGYALIGAGWLVLKNEGSLREWAYRRLRWLAVSVLVLLLLVFTTVTVNYGIIAHSALDLRPWGIAFPLTGVLALIAIIFGVRGKQDQVPFALTALFFFASFLSIVVMLWPYMIPYSVTVGDAAAPDASLSFLFYGAVVVIPVALAYTIGVYWLFRGKLGQSSV